jgi:hypothetical protein
LDEDQSNILFFREEWNSNERPLTSIHSTPHQYKERSQSRSHQNSTLAAQSAIQSWRELSGGIAQLQRRQMDG